MYVEDLLTRCLSISQEQIDPLATNSTRPYSSSEFMRNPHQVSCTLGIEVFHEWCVVFRYDE